MTKNWKVHSFHGQNESKHLEIGILHIIPVICNILYNILEK
jgi:hypothetical protein